MKRILIALLSFCLLTGCQKIPPAAPPAPPESEKPVGEETVVPEQDPADVPQEETVVPETEDVSEPEPSPAPAPNIDWRSMAAEAYVTVTNREQFLAQVQEESGAVTELAIIQGENDWNVRGLEHVFSQFDWSMAAAEEWRAVENGVKLSLYVPGEISFSCSGNGELVKLTTPQQTVYLRVTTPESEGEGSLYNLYSLLVMVAEDAYGAGCWMTPADGTLGAETAAAVLAETVVANYLAAPDWIAWKPMDMRVAGTAVFDLYHGMPEQFCFDMELQVKIEDPFAPEAIAWQAGAGLGEPTADGFYDWGRQVLVEKNEDGNWSILDYGTGGYSVNPVKPEDKPQLEWLVEQFCLTEGVTHDRIVPYLLLEQPEEELARLPQVLDQLTETEGRMLCQALQKNLLEGHAFFTEESFRTLLGSYQFYLDT